MGNALPRIQVNKDGRYLATEDGQPFFWLADTAWELFHRLDREQARNYFDNRQKKGFNVIQAVILAELDGMRDPDPYGEVPFIDLDPSSPNEKYFSRVDEYIQMAEQRGMYIALLPTWGDKATSLWGDGPLVFTSEKIARDYGLFLGKRYRHQTNILWVLGGDRPAVSSTHDYRPLWRAMAAGIDEGLGGHAFTTYHPNGGVSTSLWLHEEPWLDMNMMQSGHGSGHDVPAWDWITHDLILTPAKPTLDAEPNYEDHPVNPWPKWNPANGYFRDHDVRKQMYRSVFAGGCGVTYGHHHIWQMYAEGRKAVNNGDELIPWQVAIDRPGGGQVQFLRYLMESRPYFRRIPDQSIIASDAGLMGEHVRATRDRDGSYAFVYLPETRPVTVKTFWLYRRKLAAWWYDPRTGAVVPLGLYESGKNLTFTPPAEGPDWVLVLDDAGKQFPPPGRGA